MAGRRPKPTHLKAVQGNPGKRRTNAAEPKPKRRRPDLPPHLSEHGRKAWSSLAVMLERMGVLTEVDGYALERLADCYADILACREAIEKHGRVYQTVNQAGGVMHRPRPEVGMLADADRRFKSYLVEFGLTPAARSKVKGDGEGEEEGNAESYFG